MQIDGLIEIDGARLRSLRERQTLTPKELGLISGLSRFTIERIEREDRPAKAKLQTVRKLADALDVELWVLITTR